MLRSRVSDQFQRAYLFGLRYPLLCGIMSQQPSYALDSRLQELADNILKIQSQTYKLNCKFILSHLKKSWHTAGFEPQSVGVEYYERSVLPQS